MNDIEITLPPDPAVPDEVLGTAFERWCCLRMYFLVERLSLIHGAPERLPVNIRRVKWWLLNGEMYQAHELVVRDIIEMAELTEGRLAVTRRILQSVGETTRYFPVALDADCPDWGISRRILRSICPDHPPGFPVDESQREAAEKMRAKERQAQLRTWVMMQKLSSQISERRLATLRTDEAIENPWLTVNVWRSMGEPDLQIVLDWKRQQPGDESPWCSRCREFVPDQETAPSNDESPWDHHSCRSRATVYQRFVGGEVGR